MVERGGGDFICKKVVLCVKLVYEKNALSVTFIYKNSDTLHHIFICKKKCTLSYIFISKIYRILYSDTYL